MVCPSLHPSKSLALLPRKVNKSLHINDENDENSLESSIDEDIIKVENAALKPSTSQDTDKLDRNTLFDNIGELFITKND